MITLAEMSKSYVNGRWVPITAIPKDQLKRAKAANQFGQKHLRDVADTENAIRNQTMGEVRNLARQHDANASGTVRNIFTGRTMQRTRPARDLDLLGPHVLYRGKGQSPSIREADKTSMRMAGPVMWAQRWKRGVRTTTDRDAINAHEHAHGMNDRRSGYTRAARIINRSLSTDANRRTLAELASNGGSIKTGLKLGRGIQAETKRVTLGEEARADVMASRKLGRRVVSGHVHDTGDARDYLKARNTIEANMGAKASRKRDIIYPVAPRTAAYGVAGTGALGTAAYTSNRKKTKEQR